MNTEEDEFRRIEREALRRAQAAEDDDTQIYTSEMLLAEAYRRGYEAGAVAIKRAAPPQRPWQGLTEDEAFACKGRDYFETYKAIEKLLKERNG